jgi:uncharacterized protein YecT (DUF1311 family)
MSDPWADKTYNGFAGASELPPPPGKRRLPSRKLMLGGLAAGLALGAVLGLAARPDLGRPAADAHALQLAPRASTAMLDVEVSKPAPLPTPKSAGRLQVLSPELAKVPPRVVAVSAPPNAEPQAAGRLEPDCSLADSVAEQLVCEDPALARADRRMQQAYARALRSGAMPRRDLRYEQLDWLALRDSAAQRSPFEVRSLYEQRIDELNALADEGRG